MLLLVGGDLVLESQAQADIVQAFEQAFAAEGVEVEGKVEPRFIGDGLGQCYAMVQGRSSGRRPVRRKRRDDPP